MNRWLCLKKILSKSTLEPISKNHIELKMTKMVEIPDLPEEEIQKSSVRCG